MRTPADSRADAQRLIDALAAPLPRDDARRADAVQSALLDSGLLNRDDLGSSPAIAAAARDGLTSLAHLLDARVRGQGGGRLLLLLLAERERFTPHPMPDEAELRIRGAASALLHLALWHVDDTLRLLGGALQVQAEEARDAAGGDAPAPVAEAGLVPVTPGLSADCGELHLAVGAFDADGALAVCGRWLSERVSDDASISVPPECDTCFGLSEQGPALIFTGEEHDAWTTFIESHRGEEV
ncbi:hypothetical protein OG393_32710 (plasmid) [Streptomyces sp. NBC_01216]|uniref:hypothetical protein n=1 Tax=Streptomyces sp. NBC_01216 TaxID=2903778 RepID=UPI002E119DFC|nr:hypothetical protein OG393_32710 [Streptomyces sp. NBC_01216]